MDSFGEERSQLMAKLTTVAIFLCAAVSIACMLLQSPNGLADTISEHWTGSAVVASTLVFLGASILVFYMPRLGYVLGLTAGLAALSWYLRFEFTLGPEMNSWIVLNTGDELFPGEARIVTFATLRILSIVLVLVAIVCSSFRLLPARLLLRGYPIYLRTWPAFVLGFIALAVWFVNSVTPYRTPVISDGVAPEFRILHVEKRGLHFLEAELDTFRDRQINIRRNDRRLFQYRFESRIVRGMMPETLHERARAFLRSTQLLKAQTAPAKALRSWDAEGWYVVLDHLHTLSFTSDNQRAPPPEVTDLFYEIEKLPLKEVRPQTVRDVCMGFCYDPVSALTR
jgi:hypothetical protein